MAFNYSPRVITDGLVLYLDAANQYSYVSGSTSWNDISRGGNNGTLVNGPAFSSANGGSILFDGVDDYVSGSLSNVNIGCISMWINPSTLINSSSPLQSLIVLKYTGVSNSEWYISLGSATSLLVNEYITIADVENSTRTAIADGGSLPANTWCNLTFNFELVTYKIYVNGIQKTEITYGGGVSQLTVPNVLQLGAWFRGLIAGPFPGKIATTQIYNRSLSSAEVTQNYNATRARFGV